MTDKQPAACPSEAALDLAQKIVATFNGGHVNRPSANNPRGYTTYYDPEAATKSVAFVIERAMTRPAQGGVEAVAKWLRNWRTKCGTTPLAEDHYRNAATSLLATMAERDRALREVVRELLPSKLCGESWNLPDSETVSVTITFGTLRKARALIAQHKGTEHG